MRRKRLWMVAGAAMVLVATLLVALPLIVRWIAVGQLRTLTGRDVTIGDVDLNLFTRRLAVVGLRVGDREGRSPLLELERLDARFRLVALLRGRLHLDEVALAGPTVHVVRLPSGAFNVTEVVDRLFAGEPRKEPLDVRVERLGLRDGRVTFDDRVSQLPRTWSARELALELRGIATVAEDADGTGTLTFVLGEARVSVAADRLRLRPAHARATLTVTDLDLAGIAPYLPPGTAVHLAAGRLGTRIALEYDAEAGLRASGEARVTDLALRRGGQAEPFVSTPTLTLIARDLQHRGGVLAIGRVELSGDPTVVDATVAPSRRFELDAVRLVVEAASYPTQGPARVALTAGLPSGGSLAVRGTGTLRPSADVTVTLTDADLGLLRPYLPPDAPVSLGGGRLRSALTLAYADETGLRVSGELQGAEVLVLRQGQTEPLVAHTRLTAQITDLVLHEGALAVREVTLAGAPTVIDGSVSPAQRYELSALAFAVTEATWPSRRPWGVAGRAALRDGSTSTLEGRFDPGTLAAKVQATVADLDLARMGPYLPAGAPVGVAGGRLAATLALAHDRATGARVDGTVAVTALALTRGDAPEPVVTDPRLTLDLQGLVVKDGAVTAERLALAGTPTLVDGSVSPAQRYELSALAFAVTEATWPSRRPWGVAGRAALRDGSTSTLEGRFDPGTLAAKVQATVADLDLARMGPYLPAGAPVGVAGGRLAATLALAHDRTTGARVDGTVAVTALALTRGDAPEPVVTDPRLTLDLQGLVVKDGAVTAERLALAGTPTLVDASVSPPRRLGLRGLTLEVAKAAWPGRAPVGVKLTADLPETGTLDVAGTVTPSPAALELTVELRDAALAPYRPFLPVDAPLGGRLDAGLTVEATLARTPTLAATGTVSGRRLTLGPSERRLVAIDRVEAAGIDAGWPPRVRAERVEITKPSVLIEREKDGTLALRAILGPRPRAAASGAEASTTGATTGAERAPAHAIAIELGEVSIDGGDVRFVDRTTKPFYSEEITRLAATLRGFTTAADARAHVALQGVVGGQAALDVRGQLAPFGEPFFLDLAGELRDFSVSRTNPYLHRFVSWIARSGRLTTKVRYRVEGDELQGTNDVVVERLALERAPDAGETRSGIPVGLAVSILKDARGVIRLSVPVSGRVDAPGFSFGQVVFQALTNVATRLITAPLPAIGKVFKKSETIEALRIEPATFEPGSDAVTEEAAQQLQRVADFLRESPYVTLGLRPVVSETDLHHLKTEAVMGRIQQGQRERGHRDFDEAAAWEFLERYPDRPAPGTTEQIVATLREREPVPEGAARQLAARRADVARETLAESAGIERDRLVVTASTAPWGASGEGRVEFQLGP